MTIHHRHALGFAEAAPHAPDRALDLGSGGGVPGLVLACLWPTSHWVLLDASRRRAEFLAGAVATLGLAGRVEVRRERAEVVAREGAERGRYGLVTARSFGPPAVVAECAAPFLAVGGTLLVSEPPDGSTRWPPVALAELGLGPAEVVAARDARIARLRQQASAPERYPRRVGIPAKRPLF